MGDVQRSREQETAKEPSVAAAGVHLLRLKRSQAQAHVQPLAHWPASTCAR